jgi:phosphopantothenoylcysteine decarboxylase/phosphopantothenate--cysteine ligase
MATKAPVLIAPAMNCNMYQNPIYKENEERLRRHGYRFVSPVAGFLACGWEGEGKFQEPAVVVEEAQRLLTPQSFAGKKLLVTAGPTREEIDPVRFVSNHSSGKMGYALAIEAWRRGADVTLVSGPTALAAPWGVRLVRVESAWDMHEAVLDRATDCDVIVKAAAVADYRPEARASDKMKKSGERLTLELVKNPDILQELGAKKGAGQVLVGFAAETTALKEHALAKLQAKNLDLIVANDVSATDAGFNVDTNRVRLLFKDGRDEELPLAGKDEVARQILDRIGVLMS